MSTWAKVVMMTGLILSAATAQGPAAGASQPIKVAIIDSGSNAAYKEGLSLVDRTVFDPNGHGTLIAGIIREACPTAELYIIKVMGKDGSLVNEEALVRGIEWAISKDVRIINMSLKVKGSDRLYEVIRKAKAQGIYLVAAAGNLDMNTRAMSDADSIAYPAAYREVISVGAKDRNGRIYERSCKTEEVDLFFKGYKGARAGTSVACAYVSGTLARLVAQDPDLQEPELIRLVQQMG